MALYLLFDNCIWFFSTANYFVPLFHKSSFEDFVMAFLLFAMVALLIDIASPEVKVFEFLRLGVAEALVESSWEGVGCVCDFELFCCWLVVDVFVVGLGKWTLNKSSAIS